MWTKLGKSIDYKFPHNKKEMGILWHDGGMRECCGGNHLAIY